MSRPRPMPLPVPARCRAVRPGFTLVELVVALTITAILSTAVVVMLRGAINSDTYVRSCNNSESEMSLGVRRVANNLMEAQTGSIVIGSASVSSGANTITSSTLSTLTQPDTADNYPNGATVSYQLQADASITGQFDLTETDQRYGTNALIHNVKSFKVAAVSGVPNLYQIDIVLDGIMGQERHFKIYGRN